MTDDWNETWDWEGWVGLSGAAFWATLGISLLLFVVLFIGYTNVISRAGYSRWWILVMFVPLLNVIMLLVFCFKEWPVQRELRELRARTEGTYGYPGAGGGYSGGGGAYPGPYGGYPPQG